MRGRKKKFVLSYDKCKCRKNCSMRALSIACDDTRFALPYKKDVLLLKSEIESLFKFLSKKMCLVKKKGKLKVHWND